MVAAGRQKAHCLATSGISERNGWDVALLKTKGLPFKSTQPLQLDRPTLCCKARTATRSTKPLCTRPRNNGLANRFLAHGNRMALKRQSPSNPLQRPALHVALDHRLAQMREAGKRARLGMSEGNARRAWNSCASEIMAGRTGTDIAAGCGDAESTSIASATFWKLWQCKSIVRKPLNRRIQNYPMR